MMRFLTEGHILVAGSLVLDILPRFASGDGDAIARDLLAQGRLTESSEFVIYLGGAVGNTGLALKRMGQPVHLMSKVGDDRVGAIVQSLLADERVENSLTVVSGMRSTASIALAIPGRDKSTIHLRGAAQSFGAGDFTAEVFYDTGLFHFGYPPLMPEMYRRDGERLAELFRRARAAGCATSLDLAAVDPTTEAGRTDWRRVLERVLPEVDFFVPSVEELAYMLDRTLWEAWCRRSGGGSLTDVINPETEAMPLARRCLELGAGAVLLKCGAPGLCWCTGSGARLARVSPRVPLEAARWADKEGFQPSFRPERVLSATGAGDTCIAAFLAAALEGCGPEECAALAAAQGACCVEAYDAVSGLHTLPWLREKIAGGWAQQEI